MGRIKTRVAVAATAAGLTVGIGSSLADVYTCPGEVKETGGDISINYCDENPNENNLIDSPGTFEQKLMYGGYLLAALGGGVLALSRRREVSTEPSDQA